MYEYVVCIYNVHMWRNENQINKYKLKTGPKKNNVLNGHRVVLCESLNI